MRTILRIFAFFLMQFVIAYVCFAIYNQNFDIGKWPKDVAQNFGEIEGLVGFFIIFISIFID